MNGGAVRSIAVVVCSVAWAVWVGVHAFTVPGSLIHPLIDYPLGGFPYWREALWRGTRGAGGAMVVLLAAWQLGRACLGRVTFERRLDAVLFACGVGVVALASILLLLARGGVYRPAVVAGMVLLAAASRPAGLGRDVASLIRWVRSDAVARSWHARDVVFAMIAASGLAYSALAALAPETEYDALWYHLWLPQQWLAHGRLTDPPGEYIGLYPGSWELLNGAAMVMGGPVAARVLHFACLPLSALAACAVARWCAPGVSPALIAALAVTPPTVMWEASTAYVDLALGWMATLVAVAVIRHATGSARHWLWLAIVVAGGALGIKHLGLMVLGIAASALLAVEMRRRGPLVAVGVTVLFIAGAVALALPWYARAYAASGNPVFPELYPVFGAFPDTRWSPGTEDALRRFTQQFGLGRSPGALLLLPWNVVVHGASFGGTLGPVLLILVPFGLLGHDRWRRSVLLAAVAAYLLVWASPLGSFQLRFLIPAVPVLAVIAAAGATSLGEASARFHPLVRRTMAGALSLLLVFNLPPFIDWHERDRRGWTGWLTHVHRAMPLAVVLGAESESGYLSRTVPTYAAWQQIDALTPPDSVILTFLGGDHLYGTRRRLWSDATLATDVTWGALAGDESPMLAAAARHGVTHVLFARAQLADAEFQRLAIASARTRRCCLEPLYEDAHVLLYRLVLPAAGRESARADR